MKQLKTVFLYEYGNYMRNKVFLVFTIVITALIILFLTVPPLLSDSIGGILGDNAGASGGENTPAAVERTKNLLIVDKIGLFSGKEEAENMLPAYNVTLQSEGSTDDMEINDSIANGEYDGVFFINTETDYTYMSKSNGITTGIYSDEIYAAVKAKYQLSLYNEAGLSQEQISALMTAPQLTVIESGGSGFGDTYVYTYVLLMLLYISIILYGQMVATTVATEKSSRAMELLITSAKPNNLIFGKILGTGTAGLTQIGIWLAAVLVFYNINSRFWSQYEFISRIFNMPVNIVIYAVIFYVLGFFIFAALYGALGSLVNRVEEINTVALPVIVLVLIGFFGAFAAMASPNSLVVTILSYIPVFTPFVMFVRICVTDVPIYGIIISIALTALSAAGIGVLASKIYRLGTLMYGQRPSFKELAKMLKKSKSY